MLRTASLRHQKGLMAPWILHILSTREVRLPCLMEDESNREFPPIHDIYMSLRQRIYAVLFNLHHLRYMHTKKKGKCWFKPRNYFSFCFLPKKHLLVSQNRLCRLSNGSTEIVNSGCGFKFKRNCNPQSEFQHFFKTNM